MTARIAEPWFADARLLGVERAIEPPGALPHIASRLDAAAPANPYEAELDVEVLCVDATSYKVIRDRSDGDPARMAAAIAAIVSERGKLQNPWTGSGGILAGTVSAVGERHWAPELAVGDRVVPLASLIAIPLELDAVGPLSPDDPHVPVRGRAIVTGRMACALVPPDLPLRVVLGALDVYPAASHVRALAAPGSHVLVLGAGHAGLLAAAAAHEAVGPDGHVTALDLLRRGARPRPRGAARHDRDPPRRDGRRRRAGGAPAPRAAARRPHARLHDGAGLRGDRDRRHRRGRGGAVLLDRDVVPGRRAGRGLHLLAHAADHPQRLHRGPRELRARPPAPIARAARRVRGADGMSAPRPDMEGLPRVAHAEHTHRTPGED